VLQREVLIRKFLGAVDCPGAGAVAIDEVTTLDHEVLDHAMKLASFVALWLTAIVLCFSSAKLAKVLGSLWYNIFVQFHLNPPQFLPS